MRVRVIAVLLVLLTFVSGCGGGKTPAHAPATASARPAVPQPREPLAAAAQRLERALPGGRCEPLAALMLHSVVRGQDFRPADPPTDEECRYVRREARTLLKRFTVQRVVERGPAGVTEGKPRPNGDAIELIWVRDTDGSWKQLDGSYYRPQNGYPPERARFDSAAAAFVAGVKARDCDRMWRRLNVASRFVRSVDGRRGAFCKSIAQTFRLKAGGLAEMAVEPTPRLNRLVLLRDIAMYGLPLKSGRYIILVLSGRLGDFADDEQPAHDDPSVLNVVTARSPSAP